MIVRKRYLPSSSLFLTSSFKDEKQVHPNYEVGMPFTIIVELINYIEAIENVRVEVIGQNIKGEGNASLKLGKNNISIKCAAL